MSRVVEKALEALPADAHVLIVDDDSPDGTGAIATELAKRDARVEVLSRQVRQGLGPAYLAGFQRALDAGAEVVCQMDADLSHDPAALPDLLRAISAADLVIGSRYVTGGAIEDWGFLRRIVSRGGSIYARLLLRLPVHDSTGGFKALRKPLVEELTQATIAAQGYVFQIETTYRAAKAGFRIAEVPITFRDRRLGESKMTLGIALEAAWRVPSLRWRLRRRRGKSATER